MVGHLLPNGMANPDFVIRDQNQKLMADFKSDKGDKPGKKGKERNDFIIIVDDNNKQGGRRQQQDKSKADKTQECTSPSA